MIIMPDGSAYSAPYLVNENGLIVTLAIVFILGTLKNIRISHKRHQKINFYNILVRLLIYIYVYMLISITLFPINIFPAGHEIYKNAFGRQVSLNLNVLNIFSYSKLEIFGNLIMLIPLAFFAPFLNEKYTKFKSNLNLVFLLSLCIEKAKVIMNFFYLGSRTFDISDILLNTVGSILGYLLFNLIKKNDKRRGYAY